MAKLFENSRKLAQDIEIRDADTAEAVSPNIDPDTDCEGVDILILAILSGIKKLSDQFGNSCGQLEPSLWFHHLYELMTLLRTCVLTLSPPHIDEP